jgi:hypothetical protein
VIEIGLRDQRLEALVDVPEVLPHVGILLFFLLDLGCGKITFLHRALQIVFSLRGLLSGAGIAFKGLASWGLSLISGLALH